MRKALPLLLSAAIAAAVLAAVAPSPSPDPRPPRPGPSHRVSGGTAEPSALGDPSGRVGDTPSLEISDEDSVKRAAWAYLEALDAGRRDEAWDLLTETAKNTWREIFDAGRGEASTGSMFDFARWAENVGASTYETPRALYAGVVDENSGEPSFLDSVRGEVPAVEVEGSTANIVWEEAEMRLVLRNEDGRWLVLAKGRTYGGLEVAKLSSGREVATWVWTMLVLKDDEDVKRWEPLLPRIPGRLAEEARIGSEFCAVRDIRLFVSESGCVSRAGREFDTVTLAEGLLRVADSSRDLEDPSQPSCIRVVLHADGGMTAETFREIFHLFTDPAVRIRCIFFACHIGGDADPRDLGEGVELRIDFTWWDVCRIRMEPTAFDLVLNDRAEDNSGPALAEVLAAAEESVRKMGVRVRVAPQTSIERLLRTLVALGQIEELRIVLDLRDQEVPEHDFGLTLDGSPVRLTTPEAALDPKIELELWRPGGKVSELVEPRNPPPDLPDPPRHPDEDPEPR